MTPLSTSPGSVFSPAPETSWRDPTLDSVQRELHRSGHSSPAERWGVGRPGDRLPRVELHEALEILLDRRGEPRFDSGAVAWHARLAGHAAQLTLHDAQLALSALVQLGGPLPERGAIGLAALCERHGLAESAAVLRDWLARRDGGLEP